MNSQFSIIYTLIFVAVIAGSFAVLKAVIHDWAEYQIFLQESYFIASAMNMINYFDDYSVAADLSSNLSINISDEKLFFSRGGFFYEFVNNDFGNIDFCGSEFLIQKNNEGVSII